jgi:hypothetical protein
VIGTVTPLQLSWFEAELVMFRLNPLHAPPPVELAAMGLATVAVPEMEKSACVQAGFDVSPGTEKAVTLAVKVLTVTGEEFGLLIVPASAVEPPGASPELVDVCTTVSAAGVLVVAEPLPEPLAVQNA